MTANFPNPFINFLMLILKGGAKGRKLCPEQRRRGKENLS